MVNSKKMSKSSIAVIVLSILLVLSLILGFTGAWFTDKADKSESDATIHWGAVRVAYTAGEGSKWTVADVSKNVLPGDKYDMSGTISFTDATVEMYMLVTVENGSVAEALKQYITISGLDFTGANKLTPETVEGIKAGEKLYKVSKADLAKTFTVAAKVEVSKDTPNKVGETQLNGGADIAIKFALSVGVIQAANITAAEAYTALAAGVPAYNA